MIQSSINHVYAEFTGKAAVARKSTPEKIDAVAQGRVWTGQQAKERGLIDTLGNFGDAIQSAAKRAKLSGDYRVSYIERDSSRFERILEMLGLSDAQALSFEIKLGIVTPPTGIPAAGARQVAQELNWLSEISVAHKPYAALTHCLCTAP